MFLCVDDSELLKNKFLIAVSFFSLPSRELAVDFFMQEIAIVMPVYPLLATH